MQKLRTNWRNDWIFLKIRLYQRLDFSCQPLSHEHFCGLFSCVPSFLFNKVSYASFGFFVWKFSSLIPYSYILRIFCNDLCQFGTNLHDRRIKKIYTNFNFAHQFLKIMLFWVYSLELEYIETYREGDKPNS